MILTGKQLRDEGIARVLMSEAHWRDIYRRILNEWITREPCGMRFTGETLRLVAQRRGIESPHHHNAWGGVANGIIREWLRRKLIAPTGTMRNARDPKAHARSYRVYEKLFT
jgi:hypothetical protein